MATRKVHALRATIERKPLTWREALLIPRGFGEREASPRSMRWPKEIADKVEDVAKETRHDFSATVFYLLDWALNEYSRQREAEKAKKTG